MLKRRWLGLLVGVSLWWGGMASAQSLPNRLGVVRSGDNLPFWGAIAQRLQGLGMPYRVIEWERVQSEADLRDVSVLFLPNVQSLNESQVIALNAWMGQGGRVIASGPVGNLSAYNVRQSLRSLLGGNWAADLPRPTPLDSLTATSPAPTQPLWGGRLNPEDSESQMVATWKTTTPTPAVLVTPQSTLFGWQWGNATPLEFDQAWLRAAIARFDPQTLAAHNNPWNPPLIEPTGDPADFPAPAGIDIQPQSTQPLTPAAAIALRQELEALLNRVQSARLAADAWQTPINLATASPPTSAIPESIPAAQVLEPGSSRLAQQVKSMPASVSSNSNPAIAEIRDLWQTLQPAFEQKDYARIRQQWLAARQRLWSQYPSDRPLAQPEIRALWLDRGTIVAAGSESGLAKLFDQFAQAGINTIFFETVNAGYPIYPSAIAPQQNPQTQGWDPLAAAVKLAHARKMELHAWVWVFATGNQTLNEILGLPKDYPGPILSAHPDWANRDQRGQSVPQGQTKPFLDPANPEVRQYLKDLFSEIVTRYDVDGLQLDYIRYPFQSLYAGQTYGYGSASRQQFQKLTGIDPLKLSPRNPTLGQKTGNLAEAIARNRQLWQQWTQFRTEQVNSFVAELSEQLRSQRPGLILSAAVFPMPESERLNQIQQQWELWAQRRDIDVVVPMAYALDTQSLQPLIQPILTTADVGSALVLPGLRLLNVADPAAFDQIQALRDLPAGGYALFAAAHLSDRLQGVFQRTQGTPHPEPIPYRQPFAVAQARYQALQREWSFLLAQQQLRIPESVRSDWQTQAQALDRTLTQTANQPTPEQVTAALAATATFRRQFKTWMRWQSFSQPYQVQTWDNRLATLENLLRYGQHSLPPTPTAQTTSGS